MSPARPAPVTFLFWNVAKNDLVDPVVALAIEHSVDLVLLAEPGGLNLNRALVALNQTSQRTYHLSESGSKHFAVLTRFERTWLRLVRPEGGDSRWTLRSLRIPTRPSLLLAGVHLPSKLHFTSDDQYAIARALAAEISRHEHLARHTRTVVLGDFNMDPFEPGMQACDAMHGVLSRREVELRGGKREWRGREHDMFFNPMWAHQGERDGAPPGTYYYPSGGVCVQYWHTFDQLLVRPGIMSGLLDVRVLASAGDVSLLDEKGRPDRAAFSDHLPLLFRLRF
ncbi:MAG: hypothetical protein U0Q16_21570 [Bryobacteraceae bacterium]